MLLGSTETVVADNAPPIRMTAIAKDEWLPHAEIVESLIVESQTECSLCNDSTNHVANANRSFSWRHCWPARPR